MFVVLKPIDMTSRIYLFAFLVLYFLIVFVLRSWLLWKRTGVNPFTFDDTDDAHGYNGRLFKFIIALEVLIVAIYAFGGEVYEYLLPFWYLEYWQLQVAGWVFLVLSLVWTFTAQLQMADAWRIGIDTKNDTELVSTGLFSISRNPIFLGIILADIGLFLVAPNAFTLLIGVLSIVVIQTQVRLEEAYLTTVHGEDYIEDRKRVRRWL